LVFMDGFRGERGTWARGMGESQKTLHLRPFQFSSVQSSQPTKRYHDLNPNKSLQGKRKDLIICQENRTLKFNNTLWKSQHIQSYVGILVP
jgi:hypothetical protein